VILNDSFDLGKLKNRVDFLTQKLESEFEDLVKAEATSVANHQRPLSSIDFWRNKRWNNGVLEMPKFRLRNMEDRNFLYVKDNGIVISKEPQDTVRAKDLYNQGSKFQLCSGDNLCPESSNNCFKFEICALNSDQSLSKLRYDTIHNIVSRSSGYENDANSPPVLASLDGSHVGGKYEYIILEVSGTNDRLRVEEVYRDGQDFKLLKPNVSDSFARFKICRPDASC